ncbi:vitronectin b [Anabas testudineus]|uniref:SMB domain-containing protein n=1 Tax=Anabas testudineus TaxID=64144 RepID=A0A3Q1HTE1_ANATE|nr:vitronectin b [Anabas testudineus]
MKAAVILLALILLLDATSAAEESCEGRCGSFDQRSKCQCDSMCVYYGSCCGDFHTICPKKIGRGDVFDETENATATVSTFSPTLAPTLSIAAVSPTPYTTHGPASADTDAAPCSGRSFDAFLQLKNGSIFAFRGEYFFELDDKSVLPGYPKLIQDVWGIPGPIDAAFTRINCQGKSYIFKGRQYWRFDGDVLDEEYPRDISAGFSNIPDDIDAAFAIPASSHRGKEKAYFFKGDKYYQYEFKHQPSHEECVQMSRSSPSVLFTQYTNLYCDQTLEDLFAELFGGSVSSHPTGPRYISRDWQGIRPPVDAAMVGRVFLTAQPTPTSPPPQRRRSNRRRKLSKKRRHRRRKSRYVLFDDFWGYDDWFNGDDDYVDWTDYSDIAQHKENTSTPVQNVYFFKRDKYYRVDLQSKRVASVNPPYPRSIAKYWLGCKDEETPTTARAEKK